MVQKAGCLPSSLQDGVSLSDYKRLMKHVSHVNKLTCLGIILVKQSDDLTFDDDFQQVEKVLYELL